MKPRLVIAPMALMTGQALYKHLADALIANWPLVVVGILGVLAALRTLNAIKRQADITDSYTQPSLHIDGVRVIQFEPEHQPIFFVKIVNSGLLVAENVSISVKVALAGSTSEYQQDQVMSIPANGWRECFIVSGLGLSTVVKRALEMGDMSLRISGHVKWNEKTIGYCYKYNPWPFGSPRPQDLPLFVACDFDFRRAVGVTAAVMGHASMQAMSGSLEAKKITSGPPKETT